MTKEIVVSNGRATALIDDEDFDLVSQHKWYLTPKGYVIAQVYDRSAKKQRTTLMHRLIMGCTIGDGKRIDHINRNKLDNRRQNLRQVTYSQNMKNRRKFRTFSGMPTSSQYKHVFWDKSHRAWRAVLVLGSFEDEFVAGKIAEWAESVVFDENQRLRFYSDR